MSERETDDAVYVTALLAYQQADFDGTMVLASRQAIHETVDALRETEAKLRDALAKVERLKDKCVAFDNEVTVVRALHQDAKSALAATKAKLEAAEKVVAVAKEIAGHVDASGGVVQAHIRRILPDQMYRLWVACSALTTKEPTDAK